MTEASERLERLLKPAGAGIHTVTTGKAEQAALQRRIYSVSSDDEVVSAWRAALGRVQHAKVVVLGVPSDVGAGFRRGASFGPQALRETLLDSDIPYADDRVIDLGDVLVVPQLLDDAMLSEAQIAASRAAMWGDPDDSRPVSPLTLAGAVLDVVREVAPDAVPLVLGGDHSVAWPAFDAIARGREERLGVLHFDAHTDLLESRLGVRYCFATWAYHANERLGRSGRLVQVGIRASGHPREHWEGTLGVRQHWASEVAERDPVELAGEIVAHFEALGVQGIYVSNDIDGTDPRFGAATGTPEPDGLHPDLVVGLIEHVCARFEVWGTDLVEVAPPLGRDGDRTLETSARYLRAQIAASLR